MRVKSGHADTLTEATTAYQEEHVYFTNRQETDRETTPSGNSIWRLLPERIGVPNFELRYFEVPPGGRTSYGKHPWEHEVFVVTGEGRVKGKGLADESISRLVRPGDAVYIAPDEEHQFINAAEEPLGFICVVPKGCE